MIGEGGSVLLLEELAHALKRGTPIYAEIMGYGTTHDAYHITQPAPDGLQAEKAIRLALADAAIQPEEVDYISAHGCATILNDKIETSVIKRIFWFESEHPPNELDRIHDRSSPRSRKRH